MVKVKPQPPTEWEIQKQIMQALEVCGFEVMSTSTHGVRGPTGVTRGVPDVLVFMRGTSVCFGLEVKRSEKAKRRPEQVAMVEMGCYAFVWSLEGALDHILNALENVMRQHDRDTGAEAWTMHKKVLAFSRGLSGGGLG